MKLVIAIVHDDDSQPIMREFTRNGFRVTKLCSSGGFLKTGNTTLLIGVRNSKVDLVIEIIKNNSKCRKHSYNYTMPPYVPEGMALSCSIEMSASNNDITAGDLMTYPGEVTMSGAVIFVLNASNFDKVLYMN